MYQRVLLPLDGSELAEGALYYAKGIAGRLGLEVILLHVASKGKLSRCRCTGPTWIR